MGATSVIFGASLLSGRPVLLAGIIELQSSPPVAVGGDRRPRVDRRHTNRRRCRGCSGCWPRGWCGACLVGGSWWRAFRTEPFGGWDGGRFGTCGAGMARGRGLVGCCRAPAVGRISYRNSAGGVARLWSWVGAEPVTAAGDLDRVYAAIVGVLVAGLAQLRGRTPALLAGLLLVGTPFFPAFAPNQHADSVGCMLPPWRSPCWANVGLAGLARARHPIRMKASLRPCLPAGGWQAWRSAPAAGSWAS